MLLAYIDESGDPGYAGSPTPSFTLGVILVKSTDWLPCLDILVRFRRYLKTSYGLPMHAEIKANHLIGNRGAFQNLGLGQRVRLGIYRQCLRLQPRTAMMKSFAVVINKNAITNQGSIDPRNTAWEYTIQRLQTYAAKTNDVLHIFPDAGHGIFIRRKMRAMRRFNNVGSYINTGQTLSRPAKDIVEDPSDRDSMHSYFIQLADLNAYAAYRAVHAHAKFPSTMWDELGACRVTDVNKLRGGIAAIVSWP